MAQWAGDRADKNAFRQSLAANTRRRTCGCMARVREVQQEVDDICRTRVRRRRGWLRRSRTLEKEKEVDQQLLMLKRAEYFLGSTHNR